MCLALCARRYALTLSVVFHIPHSAIRIIDLPRFPITRSPHLPIDISRPRPFRTSRFWRCLVASAGPEPLASLRRLLLHANALIIFFGYARRVLVQIVDAATLRLGMNQPGRISGLLNGHNLEDDWAVGTVVAKAFLPPAPGMPFFGLAVLWLHSDGAARVTFNPDRELFLVFLDRIEGGTVPMRPRIGSPSDLFFRRDRVQYPPDTGPKSAFAVYSVNLVQCLFPQLVGNSGEQQVNPYPVRLVKVMLVA